MITKISLFTAGQWSKTVYEQKFGNLTYEESYQYIVGNDGIYHNIPEDETAFHAGDGHILTSLFKEIPTGIYGNVKNLI